MTLTDINKLDIVDYLESIGIHAKHKQGHQYWYISPLKEPAESKPSFKVNREINRWYDHSLKEGSTLVDFIIRHQQLTIREVLQKFNGPGETHKYVQHQRPPGEDQQGKKVEVDEVQRIESPALIRYLFERRIALDVARAYNREVRYHFTGSDNRYYALGLLTDPGGWELRNRKYKFSADPKGPSTISHDSKDVAVFEGNFNMLTLATFLRDGLPDFHVTNSAENIEATLAKLDGYRHKFLFFDNDRQGNQLTAAALAHDPSYHDLRSLYKNYNDLNEWAQNIGKAIIPPLQEMPAIGRAHTPDGDPPGLHLRHGR